MAADLVIKNSRLVSPSGILDASVAVKGCPTASIIRGNVIMEDDQVLSKKESGSFITRLDA